MIDCNITKNYFIEKVRMTKRHKLKSDAHPPKTYLTQFLEHYPNVQLYDIGIPKGICPYHLGLMNKDDCKKDRDCVECWNQSVMEGEE